MITDIRFGLKIKKVDLVSVHTWHHPSQQRRNRPYVGSRREFSQVQCDRSDFTHFSCCTETKIENRKDIKDVFSNRSDFSYRDTTPLA